MKKLIALVIGILFIASVIIAGCGGGGGGSGSSTPPPSTAPALTTDPATNITYNSARLRGTVDPNGVGTNAYFQYGGSTSYGTNTSYQNIGSGNVAVNVSEDITGLTSNTQYNFRIRAIRTDGTFNGLNQAFTTDLISPTCTTNPANNVGDVFATLNGTINPNGANVTSCYFDYGTSISYGISATVVSLPGSGTSPVSVTANVSSLTLSTQYNFRVVATNAGGTNNGLNQTFTTTALPPPTCTTNAADNITNNSARLNGTVNPNGYDVTSCWFDYGTSQSYGISATVTSLPGSGSSPVSVTANVSSLTLGTQYNCRVMATNTGGTNNGLNQTFTTTAPPPTCTTNLATNITDTSVTLNGTVNPNGVDVTSCWFDYGTSISYGISATVVSLPGSGSSPVSVTANVSSLSAGTQYNFRVVAINIGGTANGLNQTFTTATALPPAVDDYCWVANLGPNNVTRIQKSTSTTTTIAVGTGPIGVAADETYCWVSNSNSANVTRILKSNLSTTVISVGSSPRGIAADETYCWVANQTANTVTRIVKSTLVTTNITVGTNPAGIAVDGTYCWVANQGNNNVTRLTKSNFTTTTIAVGSNPEGVAVDETYCWVANQSSNNVTRILKSNLSTATITLGNIARALAVDETYCWVSVWGSPGNVTRIKKSDSTTTTITVGNDPRGVAVDGTYVWVANNVSSNVTRILKSNLTVTTFSGNSPQSYGDMTGYAYDNYSRVP